MSMALRVRERLNASLSEERKERIRKFRALRFRGLQHFAYCLLFGRNLRNLAVVYGTDKWGDHWYARHYEAHLAPLRWKRLNILEIGIGGYADPESGGGSLRMWRTYFPRSRVYGIDIADKHPHDERRIRTFRGSQVDEAFLAEVIRTIGRIDIIIDDGSHRNEHVLQTFALLFPHLSADGFYVIEDTQTSYWPHMGGSSLDLDRPNTTMGLLKRLVDGLNYSEFDRTGFEPSDYERHIVAMHFYHNLVFIRKGLNNEGSNTLRKHPWNAPW